MEKRQIKNTSGPGTRVDQWKRRALTEAVFSHAVEGEGEEEQPAATELLRFVPTRCLQHLTLHESPPGRAEGVRPAPGPP